VRTSVHLADQPTVRSRVSWWLRWRPLVWTGLAVLLLYCLGLGNHTLWGYHEPCVGGIIREMATTGDWVVPTLNGRPYLEKPPLFYALGALVCRLFGTFQPWALRLPSALLAMAASLWTCFLAWRVGSIRAAHWAGFTLATSYLFFEVGQTAVVDMTLTAAVSFALGLAFLAIVEPAGRRRWLPWFWLALGFTFLAKGVVGPVMVLAPVALTCLLQRDRQLARAFLELNWGVPAMLLMVSVWVLLLGLRGGSSFLSEVFLRNTLGRFLQLPELVPMTGRLGEHVEPWSFYLLRVPVDVLPWFAVWAAALGSALPLRGRRTPRDYFLPLAFAVNLALFSCAQAKREVYLLPVLPASFLHLALWLDRRVPRLRQRLDPTLFWTLLATLGLAGLVAAGFPWVLVREAGIPGLLAAAISVTAFALGGAAARRLWRRDYPGAFRLAMIQWGLFMASFLVIGVPAMDRRDWLPLQAPYARALAMQQAGASIACAGLSETQLGFASLTFRKVLPVLERPDQLSRALGQPNPVAVLVEPRWWQEAQALGVRGTVVPTGTDQLPPRRRLRAPVLVVNLDPTPTGMPRLP